MVRLSNDNLQEFTLGKTFHSNLAEELLKIKESEKLDPSNIMSEST